MVGLVREVLPFPILILLWSLGLGKGQQGMDRVSFIADVLLLEVELFSGLAKQGAKGLLLLFGDLHEISVLPFR